MCSVLLYCVIQYCEVQCQNFTIGYNQSIGQISQDNHKKKKIKKMFALIRLSLNTRRVNCF